MLITGVAVLFILDVFVFEKYFRYILTTAPVFILTFGGITANLHIQKVRLNLHLSFVGMTITMTYVVVKLVLLAIKLGTVEVKPGKKSK